MQKYDYIITGMGASGLMFAYRLVSDPYFDDHSILLIDKVSKDQNDRTWCYWDLTDGDWDAILHKRWDNIYFGSTTYKEHTAILPYQYKMIQGKDFYDFILKKIASKTNVSIAKETLVALNEKGSYAEVVTDQTTYQAGKVFNSVILSDAYKKQQQFPLLNQHFLGWFIKTETDIFDDQEATFMDFTVDQKGNTRFMYVLPTSKREALFEYTLFSEDLLEEKEYEEAIVSYLESKGIKNYQIVEKEKGCIPMTSYEFKKFNSTNIIHMGTAGGWTKASTGYTFAISSKKTKRLVAYIKGNTDLSKFEKRTRFWYYDLLFLDVLYKNNDFGHRLFSILFRKNDSRKILKFLDEETTLWEEIKITTSLPNLLFLKALWRRLF
ncbi:lycopene cyclase family protein [Aquimarina spongiae]|uniref:Lycopene beta-cyclase n=1 Tax=Aquimarina spongiae TaxID=570521 RepID=A0A1M6JQ64_9FLAO|nr:lycopene cyclase family protein [Aquimarina spongiae]SHJ48875.1 lycopene beta-cyclase [Aquimarina spongiae]